MAENRIGPYTIVRLIKEGGQGKVYLGYDNRLRRKVAIKIDRLPAGVAARRRALAEARKAAHINSPYVVQVYDLIKSAGHIALVMEYVPGVDLESLLQRRKLSLSSILAVGADLSAALSALRQQRLVHGDLKAGNVLITLDGSVKLTDFGVARHLQDDQPGTSASTAALTPEHLAGVPLDLRSDLFALGALLYRLLTGEHLLMRELHADPGSLTRREVDIRPRLPVDTDVPEALLVLINSLLRLDPGQRPQNTHPVRGTLRTLQRQQPLHCLQSLQREAAPYFRPESAVDVPLDIPRPLRRRGRSSLEYSVAGRLWQQLRRLRVSTRFTLAGLVVAGVGVPLALALEERPVRVHFEAAQVRLLSHQDIPGHIDSEWLMDLVYAAVESELGPLHVSGSVRPRAYYASLAGVEPRHVINTALRCDEVICAFSVTRDGTDGFDYRQATFVPGLPESAWAAVVRENSRDLFR